MSAHLNEYGQMLAEQQALISSYTHDFLCSAEPHPCFIQMQQHTPSPLISPGCTQHIQNATADIYGCKRIGCLMPQGHGPVLYVQLQCTQPLLWGLLLDPWGYSVRSGMTFTSNLECSLNCILSKSINIQSRHLSHTLLLCAVNLCLIIFPLACCNFIKDR